MDVTAVPLFSECSSSQLVRAWTGACTLFAAMPRAGEPAYDADRDMLEIIHDGGEGGGGGYGDGQVEDSDPT